MDRGRARHDKETDMKTGPTSVSMSLASTHPFPHLFTPPRSLPVSSAPRFGAHLVTSSTRRNGASGGETVRERMRNGALRYAEPGRTLLTSSFTSSCLTPVLMSLAHSFATLIPYPLLSTRLVPSPFMSLRYATLIHSS